MTDVDGHLCIGTEWEYTPANYSIEQISKTSWSSGERARDRLEQEPSRAVLICALKDHVVEFCQPLII